MSTHDTRVTDEMVEAFCNDYWGDIRGCSPQRQANVRAALSAALAVQPQEPVAWMCEYQSIAYATRDRINAETAASLRGWTVQPLYASPLSAQPGREELVEALRPFAEFGGNVDAEGHWTSRIHHERISTWFGPSDFLRARLLIGGPDAA